MGSYRVLVIGLVFFIVQAFLKVRGPHNGDGAYLPRTGDELQCVFEGTISNLGPRF